MSPSIHIRPANSSDISFIYSSWLKSFKFGSSLGKTTRSSVFFENYREIIDCILDESKVFVATPEDDCSIILGYLVFSEPDIIHYCFVKESFRQLGVAKALFNSLSIPNKFKFTHTTPVLSKLDKQLQLCTYNPFLLYRR